MELQDLASDGGRVVDHSPYYPKVKGSSPVTSAGIVRKKLYKTLSSFRQGMLKGEVSLYC